MKTAIITGCFGYIGSCLARHLNAHGYRVVGIDSDRRSVDPIYSERLRYVDYFIRADFAGQTTLKVLEDNPDATVFHLAASSLLGPSATDPLAYFDNNTSKTAWLLKAMGRGRRIIFASTAATYAVTNQVCSESGSVLDPPNSYGMSKLMSEQMLDRCYEVMGWQAVSFRFFNVAGAMDEAGQLPNTPHIINALIDCRLNGRPFTINGADYPTPDGTCIRDYVHVRDVVRAMAHADSCPELSSRLPCSRQYNLGSSAGYSVKKIVDTFSEVVGPVQVTVGPRRVGDPPYLVASNIKYCRETGFEYRYGDIVDMIKSAWEFRVRGRE